MTQPLEFRFALTKDEYARNVRRFYLLRPITWILPVLLLLPAMIQSGTFFVSPLLFFAIAGLPLLIDVVSLFVVAPWMLGQQIQRNERQGCLFA